MNILTRLSEMDLTGLMSTQMAIMFGMGLGVLLLLYGIWSAFSAPDPAIRRMQQQGAVSGGRDDVSLLKGIDVTPNGFMKSLMPTDEKSLTDLQILLARAGFSGGYAVRRYFLWRAILGILLPAAAFFLIFGARSGVLPLPDTVRVALTGLADTQVMLVMIGMIAGGFFGPSIWVRSRASERSRKISEAFPNALDLLQISTEAGLGFDAAMIRIGNELKVSAPEISEEFLMTEREIHAGRAREKALNDMAVRTGVDEVASFANAVNQSLRFGASLSATLSTYAKEMRLDRELRAQEKANRLPVQMSAVMASLMLPCLLLLTRGPVIIRYIEFMNR